MFQAMLIVLGVYLAACYAYGMYLAVRLFTGHRLRHTATGSSPRRVVRPLHAASRPPVSGKAAAQAPLEQAKAA